LVSGAGIVVRFVLQLWVDQQYVLARKTLHNPKARELTNVRIGIGTFQNYYETELLKGYSASTIAWIPSLQIFFMYAMVREITQVPRYDTTS
jgi:hypothetical protein